MKYLLLIILILKLTCQQAYHCKYQIENNPDYNNKDKTLGFFPKRIIVLDGTLAVYAGPGVPDVKLKHAASMSAQLLDNDGDGQVDNSQLAAHLKKLSAWSPVFATEKQQEEFDQYGQKAKDQASVRATTSAVTYVKEMDFASKGAGYWQKDNSVEEILHTITHIGYSQLYPQIFSQKPNSSKLTEAMDIARGGQFTTIPSQYPSQAWYTYNDKTCNYECMVNEYIYWGVVTNMGLRSDKETCAGLKDEWKLCTQDLLKTKDTKLYALVSDPQYKFPQKAVTACQTYIDEEKNGPTTSKPTEKSTYSLLLNLSYIFLVITQILILL